MMWSCVFIDIHATRSWGIVRERQPVEFTGDEQLLYEKTFSSLSPQQFEHLAAIGEWRELDAGHVVHSAGDPPESLEAVVSGQLEARPPARPVGSGGSRGPREPAGRLARGLRLDGYAPRSRHAMEPPGYGGTCRAG
jgi:hypothetical protein